MVVAVALVGCGLDLTLTDAGAPTTLADASTADVTIPTKADAEEPLDASVPLESSTDAAPDSGPDPTKVDIAFAAGRNGKIYTLRLGASTFVEEPSGGCPIAEETAVGPDGTVWITSIDNHEIFTWKSVTGCTKFVRADTTKYDLPPALGVAPRGTLSATSDELVGYQGSDYLRIDRTTGAVSKVMANALGSYVVRGDVVAIGNDGYVSVMGNTGPSGAMCGGGGDCVLPVNLVDGTPTSGPIPVGSYIEGLAQLGGNILVFSTDLKVRPLYPSTRSVGAPIATAPVGVTFAGAGARPFAVN